MAVGGRWEPDPLVLDDQALIVNVAGKGLVVITGCGHAGVVNICRYARRLTGDQPLYAVIGGFHLQGPVFEPLIPRVLDDLAALRPGRPGPRALHGLAGRTRDGGPFRRGLHSQQRRHPLHTLTLAATPVLGLTSGPVSRPCSIAYLTRSTRLCRCSLFSVFCTWFCTVRWDRNSRSAICL